MSKYNNNEELILDGTKIQWHMERVSQWERGERIAPVTIDMALTRACNYGCHFCYAMLQENDRSVINKEVITNFLKDSAEIGVKAISFVSDGESTISPAFVEGVQVGNNLGISMAVGTNGFVLTKSKKKHFHVDIFFFCLLNLIENVANCCRYCCRRMLLGHVDLIEKLLNYAPLEK